MVKKSSSFSLLLRSGLRSLKNGWAQFLSIVTIGAIAVTLFVGLLANAESLEGRVNSVYKEGNLASIWVTVSQTKDEDEKNINSFLSSDDTLDKRLYIPASLGDRDSYITVYDDSPKISKPYGEYCESVDFSSNRYFLLDKELKRKVTGSITSGFSIGDKVNITVDVSSYNLSQYSAILSPFLKDDSKDLLNQKTITLTSEVTGFMEYPENIAKSTFNTAVSLMGKKTLEDVLVDFIGEHFKLDKILEKKDEIIKLAKLLNLGDSIPCNQYLIALSDASTSSRLKEKIENYFSGNEASASLQYLLERKDMPFYATVNNDVTQARQFTFVFPFVFFLVAVLVILTTISQHVLKERTQIGTLKALGLSKGQIYVHYCSLTLLLVALGSLIGEIIGPILVPRILGNKYALLYSLPPLTYCFPFLYGILTAVVFMAISVLVTFLVCKKEVNLKPVDSMRPKKPSSLFKTMHGDKMTRSVPLLSIKMALRNIRLNIGKSIMVVVGVMGCTALLLCGFGIEDTIYHGINNDLSTLRNSDISVSFSHSVQKKEEILNDFSTIDGVDYVEPTISSSGLIYRNNGPQVNSHVYVVPELSRCYKISFGQDEIAVSKKVARNTASDVGDTLFFNFGGKTYSGKIGVIYEAFAYHGIMVHDDASFLGTPSFSYSGAQIYLKKEVSPIKVNEKILSINYVLTSQTTAQWNESINNIMSGVLTMTNAVKVFAILLALVVLYNLSLMNFRERMRDIATLKVLGFKRMEIALSLLVETMSLTLLGAGLGMFLGYPFLRLVMGTNIVELVEYLYFINPLSFVYSFLISFITALLVNSFFSLRTKKVKMVESLKSVE